MCFGLMVDVWIRVDGQKRRFLSSQHLKIDRLGRKFGLIFVSWLKMNGLTKVRHLRHLEFQHFPSQPYTRVCEETLIFGGYLPTFCHHYHVQIYLSLFLFIISLFLNVSLTPYSRVCAWGCRRCRYFVKLLIRSLFAENACLGRVLTFGWWFSVWKGVFLEK